MAPRDPGPLFARDPGARDQAPASRPGRPRHPRDRSGVIARTVDFPCFSAPGGRRADLNVDGGRLAR